MTAMPSRKQKLGIIMEKWLYAVLKSLFPAKNGFFVRHNNWKNYSYGYGLDLAVFQQRGIKRVPILLFECKNWRQLGKPYGTEIIKKHVISRFLDEPKLWLSKAKRIIIGTFESLFTKRALRLMRTWKIHLISTDKLIGSKDFRSRLFYILKAKIQKVMNRPPDFFGHFNQSKLVNYSNSGHSVYSNTHSINSTTNTKNTIPNTKKPHKTRRNRALELVFSLLNQKSGEYG